MGSRCAQKPFVLFHEGLHLFVSVPCPGTGFLLTVPVPEVSMTLGCCALEFRLPMGRGPVILRAGMALWICGSGESCTHVLVPY